MNKTVDFAHFLSGVAQISAKTVYGRVSAVQGMLIEVSGVEHLMTVGGRARLITRDERSVMAEVVGFREHKTLMLPFGAIDGIGLGCRAEILPSQPAIYPTDKWLGRVVNALGESLDGKGPLPQGDTPAFIRSTPPKANQRARVREKIDMGVRAINAFLSCCAGQRMGIFAGSGVGKSVLLSMMARYTAADVIVIGLIGERGREVQEFIHDDLGEEGLKRSVLVVATSDEAPLMRRQAAYMTLSIAEHFRDQGKQVLCLMDSVTRFAMAQREIGLSAGEPPTTKGYPPTTFAELPRLLERAGPGLADRQGAITGLFTVLVDGDDMNEPIADAVRGILDGHIVLDRRIAERNRFPAINILRSISRTMPDCNNEQQNGLVNRARMLLSTYDNMAEMIRLGAYRAGSDALVDEAIHYNAPLENFLRQNKQEKTDLDASYQQLADALGMTYDGA